MMMMMMMYADDEDDDYDDGGDDDDPCALTSTMLCFCAQIGVQVGVGYLVLLFALFQWMNLMWGGFLRGKGWWWAQAILAWPCLGLWKTVQHFFLFGSYPSVGASRPRILHVIMLCWCNGGMTTHFGADTTADFEDRG
eukprot:8733658-Karenia_brevis.AAC.1